MSFTKEEEISFFDSITHSPTHMRARAHTHTHTHTHPILNRTLAVHERANSRLLVLPDSLSIFPEITGYEYNMLVYNDLAVNSDIKASKILYNRTLSLDFFCFCYTESLYFTTRVFGHSAISRFLGGAGLDWLWQTSPQNIRIVRK